MSNRDKESLITQNYLKSILNYDSETGDFIRLTSPVWNAKIGDIAGSFSNGGYINIKINGISYQAHRLAWLYKTGNWPKFQIDHIDGINIPNFNKFSNLRDVPHIDNVHNQNMYASNTTGFRGVSIYKSNGKYKAQIQICGKKIALGYFNTPEEASIAYEAARAKYFIIK